MTVNEAIKERHSVRTYDGKPIEEEKAAALRALAAECNGRSGLHFQIVTDSSPEWYKNGIEAVLLAPTAINQQKFKFSLDGEKVIAVPGSGIHTKIDLGIAEYHFDIGSDRNNFGFERELL